MIPPKKPSIVVCYYDTKTDSENQPKRVANRCTTEITLLCQQLGIISEQLALVSRRKDIDDVVNLCQFHHENFLFRVYSLRERVWDVLAALGNIRRDKTGDKNFRQSVLLQIKANYPELDKAFSNLQDHIDSDVKIRNVVTHETFVFLGLTFSGDFRDFYEIDGVLTEYDPQSKEGLQIQEMVRKALREFVNEDKEHIQKIIKAASVFTKHCRSTSRQKQW